ncbi:hypothetical protein N7456_006659 [Penicillium angulare]|uniref:t-SNARE coiled-coil homology domain-containing protein n=1 Tax=Penicillium angulare TaxID=116970 RepID=A0A9W9KD34_9EURO|nr:hypothetical protein N7456_006659 [Penicillium angulare]
MVQDLESGRGSYALQDRSSMAAVLSKRRKVDQELSQVKRKQEQLQPIQQALLDSTTSSDDHRTRAQVDSLESEITECFHRARSLAADAKQGSDMYNPRIHEQLTYITENIRRHIEEYRRAQRVFATQLETQVRRRYGLVNPEASEQEIENGVQNILYGDQQAFQVQGMRSAKANEARDAVLQRSTAIRRILEDLQSLNELFEEVGELVEKHQVPLDNTVKNVEETVENYQKSTRLLDRAIISARNARKYKWWILFVCVLIVAIIVAVIIAWGKINHKF